MKIFKFLGTKTSPHYFCLFDMLPFLINNSTGFSVDQLVNCWEACWSSVVVWWVESYLWWIYSALSASVHSDQSFYFMKYSSAWFLTPWSLSYFPPYFSTLVFSSLIFYFLWHLSFPVLTITTDLIIYVHKISMLEKTEDRKSVV